jgi:hypothetical protein
MIAKYLTITGLLLDIIGVVIVWRFALPQPTFEKGAGLAAEDNTPVGPHGETALEMDRRAESDRQFYRRIAFIGLFLIVLGFLLQLLAQIT